MKTLYESLLDDVDLMDSTDTIIDCMDGCVTNGLSFRLGLHIL